MQLLDNKGTCVFSNRVLIVFSQIFKPFIQFIHRSYSVFRAFSFAEISSEIRPFGLCAPKRHSYGIDSYLVICVFYATTTPHI